MDAAQQLLDHIMNYLHSRNAIPEVNRSDKFSGRGEFRLGEGLPNNGQINLKPNAPWSTLIHELAHAADRQFSLQFYENPRADTMFNDAYRKLIFGDSQKKLAEKLDPTFVKDNDRYRASSEELPAFAAGNSSGKDQWPWSGGSHIDATLATEQMLLMDLATRKKSPY